MYWHGSLRPPLQERDGDMDEEEDPGDRLIRVTYHGIVNLEDDVTAQKFGTHLKPEWVVAVPCLCPCPCPPLCACLLACLLCLDHIYACIASYSFYLYHTARELVFFKDCVERLVLNKYQRWMPSFYFLAYCTLQHIHTQVLCNQSHLVMRSCRFKIFNICSLTACFCCLFIRSSSFLFCL